MEDELAEEIGGERDIEEDLTQPVQRSELRVPVLTAPQPQEMMKDVGQAARIPFMPVPVKKSLVRQQKRPAEESLEPEGEKKPKKTTKSVQVALSVRSQPKRKATEEIHPPIKTEKKKKSFLKVGGEKRKPETAADEAVKERKRKMREDIDTTSKSEGMSSGESVNASVTGSENISIATTTTTSRKGKIKEPQKGQVVKQREGRSRSRSSQRKEKTKFQDFAASTLTTSEDEDADAKMRVTERKSKSKSKFKDAYRTPLPSDDNDEVATLAKLVISDGDKISNTSVTGISCDNTSLVGTAAIATQSTLIPTTGTIPKKRFDNSCTTTTSRRTWDIRTDCKITLPSYENTSIDLDLAVELQEELALLILGSAGLAHSKLTVIPTVIDSKFRSKIQLNIFNHNSSIQYLSKGQRIATCYVLRLNDATFVKTIIKESTASNDDAEITQSASLTENDRYSCQQLIHQSPSTDIPVSN